MNILSRILPRDLPVFVRKAALADLFAATADAFQCPTPPLSYLSYDERLRAYALFTREQADKVLRAGGDLQAVKGRLYINAYPIGAKLRKWFDVRTAEDVMRLGRVIYRAIGVEIAPDPGDDACRVLTAERCYFSSFYSAAVCDLISALDDGVFSGLSGSSRLVFSQRLTEGSPCCKARLQPKEL